MVKYWKILGDVTLNINTAYNISLCCIIIVFFVAAYVFGCYFHASDKDTAVLPEGKEITFTVEKNAMDAKPQTIENITEPKETEVPSLSVSAYYYDLPLSDEKQDYVFEKCEEYDVPCELVFAVMGAESTYTEDRISSNGDYGIMQINEINHPQLTAELGVTDFMDYEQNVLCGVYMLSHYYHLYTDFNKIAMCYRYGENGAKEMWDHGIYETDYTRQIVRAIAMLSYR